jgi:hypothetical protein
VKHWQVSRQHYSSNYFFRFCNNLGSAWRIAIASFDCLLQLFLKSSALIHIETLVTAKVAQLAWESMDKLERLAD